MQQTENLAPHVQEIARAVGSKMDAGAIEDELRRYLEYGVPLAQAKRDIVRMHGGTLQAGMRRVADLQPEERGVDLKVKILTVNPKQITVKGQPKQIFYGYLADASGKTPYTAWKDLQLERGANYVIKNAYVKKGFREGVDVQLGDYTNAARTSDAIDVKDDFAPNANSYDAGARLSAEHTVKELRDGMGSVTLTARILEAREKVISTANGQKTLVEGELADDTGRAPFSAWEPEKLPAEFKENAVVRVKGAYVRAFRGVPSLNFGQYATVEILPATALPDKAALLVEKPFTLGELEAIGGGDGILVRGVVIDVKKGSGIIFRCGALDAARGNEPCKRVLQAYECRVHGKNDTPTAKATTPGRPRAIADLRIKAVLDDGHGAATFFANREATERVLGKTLAQCEEAARDAMTTDVIQDELTDKLTARRVALHGWARTDEFGLTLNATAVELLPPPDAASEAEALLAKLAEAFPEVAS
jgi:replication factor A1